MVLQIKLVSLCVCAAALCCAMMVAEAPAAKAGVPRIIFDSDMSSDHDDVGDIAILHGLASMGECEIIGMMVSSRNGGTALCMDAINTYYGRPDIPIGVPPDIGGIGEYAGQIATEFPHDLKSPRDCPQSAVLYRELLASAPDKSVTIVTTGYLNNLKALLLSGPDQHSPLSGLDLIRKKVKLWSCAGGCFPKGDEFNFRVMADAAYHTVNHWPVAVLYVGFDVGQAIYTCGRLPEASADNPIRRVYVDIKKQYPYPSWGQIAIYCAVRGSEGLWGVQHVGCNKCNEAGSNWWSAEPDPTGDQEQGYLLEKARTPVQATLDALIMLPPSGGAPRPPGEPSDLRAKVSGGKIDLQWTDNAYNETGFKIERASNGVYTPIGAVGANVTRYSDTGLSSTANVSYRVKATHAAGDSRYACVWVYSGWTEINFARPADLPLYTYEQCCNLRAASAPPGGVPATLNDHVTLNNDSSHGQNITLDVDVSALGHEGNFYVYFFYQDADHWYRLNHGEKVCKFEKRIKGVTTQIGEPLPIQNLGNGSPLQHWRIKAAAPGSLQFIRELPFAPPADKAKQKEGVLLDVSEPFVLTGGKLGLGGWARTPVWENFHFDAPGGGGTAAH